MDSKLLERSIDALDDANDFAEWPRQALDGLFLEHCAQNPEKPAVLASDESLTYSELESKSRRWADWLISRGLGPGSHILVCVDRTAELPAILLGVLRSGACYVPIDPTLPVDRVAVIIEDSGAHAAITDDANTRLIPDNFSDNTLIVGGMPEVLEAGNLPPWVPDDLAYILFTSGSTGRPKGVPILRGAMANFLIAMSKAPGIVPEDRFLVLTTVSFDMSVLEIFLPLISGASLYMASRNDSLDPASLSRIIEEQQLTQVQATPATWRMLVDFGWKPSGKHKVISGGEAFPVGLARSLCETAGEVWNGFGPTEATVYSSVHRVTWEDIEAAKIPLGKALPNLVYRISDDYGGQCPPGQPGELWIAGVGVTPGYYRRPDLNGERFVETDHNGEYLRFYRTGDLVCLTEEGSLLYIDRLDNQVKIRGFRVELGEIETALSNIPAIGESAVVLAGIGGGVPVLVGCIRGEKAGDHRRIESLLSRTLPAYMVPKVWRWYSDLPVTPSMKIDRKALKARVQAEEPARQGSEAVVVFDDRSTEEMATRWERLLGVKPGGIDVDFFTLGGHSLLAARLSVELQQETGKHVRPVDLLSNSTLQGHIELLQHAKLSRSSDLSLNDVESIPEKVPLSPAQKRMWYAVRAATTPGAFYESEAYRINAEIDLERLQEAIQEVLASHIAFRMVIDDSDELKWRFVSSAETPKIVTFDKGQKDWKNLARMLSEEATRPFDFYSEPLARFTIYTDHANQHAIQFVAHHMVIDGLSQTTIWKEIAQRYRVGGSWDASEPTVSLPMDSGFAAYLCQSDWSGSADLDYWVSYLADAPGPLDIKPDFPRPPVQQFSGTSAYMDLPKDSGDALRSIARDLQVTPFAIALSLYALFLDKHAQQRSYVIGVPVNGRQPPVTPDMVGLFINTIPLRVDVDQGQRFDELVKSVSRSALKAMEHDDVPFDEIVNAVCNERDPSRMPVYQTMLGLNDYSERPSGLSQDSSWMPEVVDAGFSQFDVLLFVEFYPDRLRLRIQGNSSLYTEATLKRFLNRFQNMLQEVINAPDTRCNLLAALAPEEKAQIERWSGVTPTYPRDSSIDECFLNQVRAAPEATAISSGSQVVTYKQLSAQADDIARMLFAEGIEAGERVGISSRRTAATIAGILGILRLGASYVPLDLDYPDERLVSIQHATGVRIMLANSDDSNRLNGRNLSMKVLSLAVLDGRDSNDVGQECTGSAGPDDSAYVMFTSGSTGVPKGIEVSHRNILRLVLNTNFMPLGKETRFLMYAPLAFDASTLEIWGPLLNGGTLVIPEHEQLSVEELDRTLEKENVSALWLTAALFHHVAEHSPEIFRGVSHLLAGGDVLSPKWVGHVLEVNPGLTLINGYGPTENTTFTCCYPMKSANSVPTPIPVGYPVANTTVHILDPYGNPSPIGVPGNLYTGGDGVALGYVNDTERTAKAFLTNPFSKDIGRVYDTGDRACWQDNGAVEFLGRSDNQIKIRGFRIDPDEISSVLEQYPGIEQAITGPWTARSGEKQLVSYITPILQNEAARAGIKTWLSEKLPRYMVPEHIIDLATFPVGTTGKVDRKNLPDPDDENTRDGTTEKTEPETPTEKQLAEIWEKVLNQKGISREDNFFHLGGTSIKALQVFSSIVREMSLDIPLSTLLTHPTLAGLASALDRASGVDNKEAALQDFPARKGWDSLVPMGGAGRKHPIICVHAVGGNVLSYRSTLETIAKNRPRVGFQSIGLDGHGEPKPTLHEQASDYVRELLEAGYEGPFTIMGGSMGGTIALEMASILTAQSHEVDWVVLLDTIGPAGRVVGVGEDEKAPNMAERVVQGLSGRFTYYAKSGVIALYRRLGAAIPYKLRPFFIQERNKQALSRHEEQPYSGNVFLIRGPENSGGIYSDPKLGWEGILSGTLRIELADVSHDEFMESPLVIERLENFFNGSAGAENGEV